ncbi:MAG: CotH kinase family protein [Rikenellaceae bacterium]
MKIKVKTLLNFAVATIIAVAAASCSNFDDSGSRIASTTTIQTGEDPDADPTWSDSDEFTDWDDATHSKNVDPDFDEVFAQNVVQRIDITISYENWLSMWADLGDNITTSSNGWGGQGQVNTDLDFTPIWVPCTITYKGTDWYKVGLRFKGNSSLVTAYSNGISKLSMKLDFDEFEDDYPALKNQRFYGFKQLNLNNNYNDQSLMREKVGADIFRAFGIPAAHTTFCEVYVNYGAGDKYFGLYTIVEEVDDTLVDDQQYEDGGNLYKPDGDAATFASGTYNTDEFYLKTNTKTCDYSDVKELYDTLHSSLRTTDNTAWQERLEACFNVDHFLKWLAVNATIQNWDTYGRMSHNYYLYNNPEDGLLTWIPWDNNEALQSGNSSIEVSAMKSVSSSWPLISYIIAVEKYENIYKAYLQQFIDEVFTISDMQATYTSYQSLIYDSASKEQSGYTFLTSTSSFNSAVTTLKSHVSSRNTTVKNYLK